MSDFQSNLMEELESEKILNKMRKYILFERNIFIFIFRDVINKADVDKGKVENAQCGQVCRHHNNLFDDYNPSSK